MRLTPKPTFCFSDNRLPFIGSADSLNFLNGIRHVNVVPTPSVLSTRNVPIIFVMILDTIAIPRPVPFVLWDNTLVICSKSRKILSSLSTGIPIPVSATDISSNDEAHSSTDNDKDGSSYDASENLPSSISPPFSVPQSGGTANITMISPNASSSSILGPVSYSPLSIKAHKSLRILAAEDNAIK